MIAGAQSEHVSSLHGKNSHYCGILVLATVRDTRMPKTGNAANPAIIGRRY